MSTFYKHLAKVVLKQKVMQLHYQAVHSICWLYDDNMYQQYMQYYTVVYTASWNDHDYVC